MYLLSAVYDPHARLSCVAGTLHYACVMAQAVVQVAVVSDTRTSSMFSESKVWLLQAINLS